MSGITGFKPYMWGPSIIGFGNYHYKYQSGHEGDAPLAGFSPRKNAITIYMASKFPERDELLKQLGKYKLTVACIYIKTLDDINISILKKMISASANKKALSQLKNRSITHNFFLHGGSSTFRLRRFAMIKS
jgi:hypothetical protein